ncbi:MAG: glycan-binding surface protein [Mangrovibacterium sp.]
MKKIVYTYIHYLQLLCIAAVIMFVSSCQDDKVEPPVITGVVNYEASPNDTVVTTIQAGQWVVLLGRNLSGVTQVYFGSIPATINTSYFTDGSIVVQLPDIPFPLVPADKLNIVTAISEGGIATFDINIVGDPIISRIRNYEDSPNDTVVNVLYPGDEINIVGFNLKNVTEISFQGVLADLTNIVYTDTSAIVQVPADLSGSSALLANTITYTTTFGSVGFPIKIVGPPVISFVSYEVPKAGDMVHLYGYNFTAIQSLTFAGTPITEYEVSVDESTLSFAAPALTQSGPVEIVTLAGSYTTVYNVNDIDTGALSNFGSVFNWDWWAASLAVEDASFDDWGGWIPVYPEFVSNGGKFLVMKTSIMAGGAGADWTTAVRIPDVQWVPAANITDPVDSWALKFEISIPQAWNGTTLVIKTENGDYAARYEPWQVSDNKTVDYTTDGWQTLSIPLSAFRANSSTLGEGKGTAVASLKDLLDDDGKSVLRIYPKNYGTEDSKTIFFGGFDNFRVVRR